MSVLVNIGLKIRKIRNSRNMSQERFGYKLGLSGKTISAYETGRSVPPLKVLESISRTYGINIVQLMPKEKDILVGKVQRIKSELMYIETAFEESLSL
ncbi:helix-turn-helix transcriptional regulator [Patescibacteria group bacterium]|nr:helix-turn-helix transcriptional regulator [Patescibacteria group bacterium]